MSRPGRLAHPFSANTSTTEAAPVRAVFAGRGFLPMTSGGSNSQNYAALELVPTLTLTLHFC